MSWVFLVLLTGALVTATPTLAPTGDIRKRTPNVPLGLLFPLSQGQGSQMAAAAILAVETLNADRTLLQGSTLTFMLNDTRASTIVGPTLAEDFIDRDAVAIIGAQESSVSRAVASMAQTRNVMQLSYQSGDPILSDKRLFPLFGRVSREF